MATDWGKRYNQSCSIVGDFPHSLGDGGFLMEPAEAGVSPPGLGANKRGVGHVDADGDVVNRLWKDRRARGEIWKYVISV